MDTGAWTVAWKTIEEVSIWWCWNGILSKGLGQLKVLLYEWWTISILEGGISQGSWGNKFNDWEERPEDLY